MLLTQRPDVDLKMYLAGSSDEFVRMVYGKLNQITASNESAKPASAGQAGSSSDGNSGQYSSSSTPATAVQPIKASGQDIRASWDAADQGSKDALAVGSSRPGALAGGTTGGQAVFDKGPMPSGGMPLPQQERGTVDQLREKFAGQPQAAAAAAAVPRQEITGGALSIQDLKARMGKLHSRPS